MAQTAKLFKNGKSQAVRLPVAYRFDGTEVCIRRDPQSGDVILSRKPDSLDQFFAFAKSLSAEIPDDFLGEHDRATLNDSRDPLAEWDGS